jgi:6-phosphogluconolactonase
MSFDRADLQVFENGEAVAQAAAAAFVEIFANSSRDRVAVCLSGGSTPKRLYQLLKEPRNANGIPWDRVHWFWGDERFVPMRDERSNAGMAWGAFLAHAPAPLCNVHVIPLTANTAEDSADLYEAELKAFYGTRKLDPARPLFDLVLLGLGEDGHTASLFPGSKALGERERWVTAVVKAGQEPYVPRMTLTIPALKSAREVLFLVSGSGKRNALARVLAGEDLPAARVRPIGRLRWLVDRAAAQENTP